jgi:signal transduction histidine kinase
VLVSNERARVIAEAHMSALFEGITRAQGRTIELDIGNETYLCSSEHVPGVGTIVVMQDITYVKELEEVRSELMHTITHDLKSPLTSIIGFTHILERTATLEERSQHFLEQINIAATRILDMIGQLLRTVDDSTTLGREMAPLDLSKLVQELVNDVEGAAVTKHLTLQVEQVGQPAWVVGDRRRLYHAILNLLDNAIKFTTPGTVVTLNVDYGQGAGDAIVLRLEDEGPGIEPSDLEHLFERHYRGKRTAGLPGFGVGLSLVRSTAAAHGGTVCAENRPEGGATFTLRLPASIRLPAGQDATEKSPS